MRQVMSISLPSEVVKEIKQGAKQEKCATPSEFIRHLVRMWRSHNLAVELRKSSKEFRAGKAKKLKSLADLD